MAEIIWVKIKGGRKRSDFVTGIYYRPLEQKEERVEEFGKQLISQTEAYLIVMVGRDTGEGLQLPR